MYVIPAQDTLVKRLGAGAVPFSFSVSSLAPPSVTLLPARSYAGAPIGTNYDLRIFVGECVCVLVCARERERKGCPTLCLSARLLQYIIAFPHFYCATKGNTASDSITDS